jgi:RNA polymerase sigma-70 factor (ECF subfamily)
MTMTAEHTRRQFSATHWSMVMNVDATRAPDARAAQVELCLRAWYPVYAYLRHHGHSPEAAAAMTRDFLQHLFQHFRQAGTAHVSGFRQYLIEQLRGFLETPAREAATEPVPELVRPPDDLEVRHQRDNASAATPEQAYQQSFAFELLARALARLRTEAGQTGRLEMFEAIEPYIAIEPSPAEGEQLARRLRLSPFTMAVALKRLRQRFRELIDLELADTVVSADELLAEQQALYAVLRGAG